jgi:hypothetical protein
MKTRDKFTTEAQRRRSRNQNEISREDTKAKTEFHNKVTKAAKIRDINSSLWPLRPCCEIRYVVPLAESSHK